MIKYQKWLEAEFAAAVAAIDNMPQDRKKGRPIALLRLRARGLDVSLKYLAEYKAIGKLAKKAQNGHTPNQSAQSAPPALTEVWRQPLAKARR